jgi:23S rRNA pseudouridine2605 synthase
MIKAGRVTVDGAPAHLGQKIDPDAARVVVDGLPLPVRPDLAYYLLYKPAGVISSAGDPRGRTAVTDLVPSEPRVYPVGRLDADSEGLLLLTNDGELTNLITHPSHRVPKTYVARVSGTPGNATLRSLQHGVELGDGPARAQRVRLLDAIGDEALVEVVMGEGRKREVRRMFEAVGHPVTALVRTAIGPLSDRGLAPGEWRPLTLGEVRALYGASR